MQSNIQDTIAIEQLQQKVAWLRELPCADCGHPICGHEATFAVAVGSQDVPRCLTCLAHRLGQGREALRDHLYASFQRRECYRTVWQTESQREDAQATALPSCLWPADALPPVVSSLPPEVPNERVDHVDEEWDAGDMACGDLLLALRLRLNKLAPRAVIKVLAQDPAAPEDIPAWCRLTGHTLIAFQHPEYFIRRKEG